MPIFNNNQLHFATIGTRVFFKRDAITSGGTTTRYPMVDLGLMTEPASPAQEPQQVEFRDPFFSNNRIGVANPQIDETYDLACQNLSPQNMALYFMATPPAELSVTGSAATDVAQGTAVAGRSDGGGYHKIIDANGDPVYNLASVDEVTNDGGTTALTEGTDYVVEDLEWGIVRLLPGGEWTDAEETTNLTIDYTTKTQSGYRIVAPQSQKVIEGNFWMIARECPGHAYVREGRGALSPSGANFQVNAASDITLQLLVLADTAQACDSTFGRLVQILGDVASNVRI